MFKKNYLLIISALVAATFTGSHGLTNSQTIVINYGSPTFYYVGVRDIHQRVRYVSQISKHTFFDLLQQSPGVIPVEEPHARILECTPQAYSKITGESLESVFKLINHPRTMEDCAISAIKKASNAAMIAQTTTQQKAK